MQDYETSDLVGFVAVIGMAVRVPGANNLQDFWENLRRGVDSITHFTDEEMLYAGIPQRLLDDPNYVKANGRLPNIEMFDAGFFGINKRDAQITDPQHRIFLECAWEALESAGYDPFGFDGRIGVFASESLNSYFIQNLYTNRELLKTVGGIQMILGNDRDFLATRVSFLLNLRGPSIVLQSACSSSLSAVHLACQSLNNGESDMVLAGGVSINLPQNAGYLYHVGGIYSADGRCCAFDEKATGTVGGNGVGLVVLKRLEDALNDGDYVYSVIRGSAINNDGNAKVGYTAPSVQGQAEVIEEALAVGRVDASTITYVEAHGTGTTLGDPIEVEALTKAFSSSSPEGESCAIGSVKTNLGHLDAAAGVVGLIKTSLMLKHRELVPSLHFDSPNPKINFAQSPFYVNVAHREWKTTGLRRAGVSSFGIGGTNVHVVLEEFRENKNRATEKPEKLFVFSAKNDAALRDLHEKTAAFLEKNENVAPGDAAFTLQTGRRRFEARSAVVCRDRREAVASLKDLAASGSFRHATAGDSAPEIAFLFPGQGPQYPAMAKEIYQSEDIFRELFDRCATAFRDYVDTDLVRFLYAGDENAAEQINQPAIAHPLLFSVEYALAGLLKSWGITPAAMIGHSLGEYMTACIAGVFSFEDAVKIVARRSQLMQKLPAGGMLSVKAAPEKIKDFLDAKMEVSILNAPELCAVSGPIDKLERLRAQLEERQISCKLLKALHAYHSAAMNDILEPFYKELSEINLSPPKIPFISNLTGTWIKDAEAVSPEYWVKHLRHTVKFSDGVQRLAKNDRLILVEVGPNSLSILAQMQTSSQTVAALPAAGENVSSLRTVMELVGKLWTAGYEIDWRKFNAPVKRGNRIPMPTYPFQHEYFWVEPSGGSGQKNVEAAAPAKTAQPVALPSIENRREAVWKTLREIIFDLTGSRVGDIDPETTFYQLGVDSLLMIQASLEVGKRLGVEISFRQMLEEYPTLNALAEFLSENYSPAPVYAAEERFDEPLPSVVRGKQSRDAETIIHEAIVQLQQALASLRNGNHGNGLNSQSALLKNSEDYPDREALGGAPSKNDPPESAIPATRENADDFPLTEGQQQIWLACRLSDESCAAYNESVSLQFKGTLDTDALVEAVNRLVARHEALRVIFSAHGDFQKVLREVKITVARHDLSSLSTEEKESTLKNLVEREARTPFNLVDGPLVRAALIKADKNSAVLCLTIHHLVVDGWSFSILLKELKELYAAIVERTETSLSAPPSYREFTESQISRENDAAAENFWLGEFADAAPVADLPTDFPRPESMTSSDDEAVLELDAEYVGALKAICDRTGGTTFISLMTVCTLALSYILRKNDFIVGIHSAGQLNAGARDLVGYYVNLLPLRTKINPEGNFAAHLNELKAKLFEIYKYQSYPLGKLIKKLNPPRLKGRSPLIAVTFNSFRAYEKESFGGLTMETQNNLSGYSRFDLSFTLLEWDDKLEWRVIFNKDVFTAETVQSWLRFMSKVLLVVSENTEITVNEITAALENYEAELKKSRQQEFKENRLASLRKFTRKNI